MHPIQLDITWMLFAAGLVMLMQVGFLLLEAGMVRSKNSINVAQKNLLDFVFGVIAFAAIGFMIAFGSANGGFGWDSRFYFLRDLTAHQAAFFVFQVMFCGTAATIVSGAVAERMKLPAYVFGSLVLSGFIYPVFAHWTWGGALFPNPSAFLAEMGFVDFAGSTVVHATGGWIALAACIVVGPRVGRFREDGTAVRIAGHNPVLSTTGALLLFVGWIGFNGGSTLAASDAVPAIILNTVLAGGMGACVGYVIGFYQDGVILPEKSSAGLLGGLVAVTASCHLLDPASAMMVGALGGAVAIFGNAFLEQKLRIDDAVGAIGVHAFAGAAGTLAVALFAPVADLPAGGRLAQLHIQLVGIGINFYWAFGLGYAFFWLIDRTIAIRVSGREEEDGLNVAEHATRLGVGHVEDALAELVNGTADLGKRLPVVAGDEAERLSGLFNRLIETMEAEERSRQEVLHLRRDDEEAERVAALANATFEAILIHRHGILVDGNQQLAQLVGAPLNELIGRPVFEFLKDGPLSKIRDMTQMNDNVSHEIVLRMANGEEIPVEARGRDIVYRGEKARIGCIVDLRERKMAEQRIRHLALHDPHTGLPNRALFAEQISQMAELAMQGEPFALLLVDIDRFKEINDVYGHQGGDAVIAEVARRLAKAAEAEDLVARLGGDEFALVLRGVRTEEELRVFATSILGLMRQLMPLGSHDRVTASVSLGGALCPDHAPEPEMLIGCADIALQHAKESGRNTYVVFQAGMNELIEKRRALELDLAAGLERGEFQLYLQPRVEPATAAITSYEALVRWNHPKKGMVSPGDFIPVAEASGQIIRLGEWVLAEACRLLDSVPGCSISVNVSPLQFRHADFLPNLHDVLVRTGANPARLELEITESVLIENDQRAVSILDEIKHMGFGIALDDFGTGYSSLSYLSRYPFDTIKIDRSFVSNLATTDNAPVIVRSIIELGAGLGMKIVAEGVETIEEALFLAQAGCDELQGYLLGRPKPLTELQRGVDNAIAVQLVHMHRSPRPIRIADGAASSPRRRA
ncbi:Amt family ammonium transporter [Pseudorhizobium tarimense]|uniref:Amt family ammonium transporter n=1 Tax=Pseudorhizobium tarimense TaxID=1079109 RepID=A0ABV2HC97_9HYPH